MSTPEPRIVVTTTDMERLRTLVDTTSGDVAEALDAELLRAEVVEARELPPDVVTMNSRVVYRDEETRESREVTLSYPQDASLEQGRISVLAPVGAALLGLSVGQEIEWQQPGGKSKRLRILSVTYQPQAAGETH
ncbi:nucleoside diphosphate kinase regulator [Archangium primigenium]|uniref:nucleoside diphosphate kinase regulator n=1 Tax=[Archangium] primigenium TaxID=2792470 RepID=UPI00195A603D|nr:nucleoside diphosphate kinase regulator [Archangium primigenium]MBM7118354.1 nucleoside diphosphate kinase regulator [Archangium primigenium]